ncbi:MAG: phosphoribosylpyrophosphate synthetase [Ignavibacteriae bacterium]|nr:phosphoribosylpyrophosphate synthetase [Ignavibacteriota bacterium]
MSEKNYMTTLSQMIPKLREMGYTNDFEMIEGGMLAKQTNEAFQPDELIIERVFRFEGNSNPDDEAVLYGVRASNGIKGIIIDAYGADDDDDLAGFLRKVKTELIDN